ncbi:hypothetical protein GCM10011369_23460 [Neiella marina]|uniref:Phage tail tape measure protein n=1 Tax=Neiella marina TaxID=508461 RepID=A0A8J2U622_9GAMM|nr:hypothetical protein [Neiella marina]GGA80804.1 hypothetical protein GCM10011369_23460 [Neiella marina]
MAKDYVVKLIGDAKSYVAEFGKSIKANKQFALSLKKASDRTKVWASQSRAQANIAGKAIGGFAAVAAGALAAVYAKQSAFIDQQAKTADRLGITTKALTGMQHAAEQTGVSTESLNMGLQRMTRRIGQVAATGKGEAVVALEQLGIAIDDIKGKSPDQQFALIAEKMKDVDDQGKKVFLTQKLFDSEGVKLLNTLDLGADGLQKMIEEAEALGIAFTRIDAAKVEMANDQFDKAQKTLTSFGQQLTVETAPIVGTLSDMFVDATKEAGGMGQVATKTFGIASKVAGVFADGLHGINILFKGAKVLAMGFSATIWKGLAMVVNKGIIPFANGVTNGMLYPLRQVLVLATKIPGIGDAAEAALQKMSGLGKMRGVQALDNIGDNAVGLFDKAVDDLHNTMMEPLPSERIKEFVADAQAKFQQAAKEQAKKVNKESVANSLAGEGDSQPTDADKQVEAARKRYQQIHEEQLKLEGKEKEIEDRRYERQKNALAEEFAKLEEHLGSVVELEAKIEEERARVKAEGIWNVDDLENNETSKLFAMKLELQEIQALEAEYRTAKEQAEAQHKEKLAQIDKDHQAKTAQGYDMMMNVMGDYFNGMEGKHGAYAKAAMSIGETMMDAEKRKSIQSIWTNTYDTAMKAYNALASIPYVGPVLGGIAAGAVIGAGTLYAGKVSGLSSFDGGGFTGNIPRWGGIDGKGGFPAILHGNETVIDHTKGQQLQQANQNVAVNYHFHGNASENERMLNNNRNATIRDARRLSDQLGRPY